MSIQHSVHCGTTSSTATPRSGSSGTAASNDLGVARHGRAPGRGPSVGAPDEDVTAVGIVHSSTSPISSRKQVANVWWLSALVRELLGDDRHRQLEDPLVGGVGPQVEAAGRQREHVRRRRQRLVVGAVHELATGSPFTVVRIGQKPSSRRGRSGNIPKRYYSQHDL